MVGAEPGARVPEVDPWRRGYGTALRGAGCGVRGVGSVSIAGGWIDWLSAVRPAVVIRSFRRGLEGTAIDVTFCFR